MGYAQPGTSPLELVELAREAERCGYDSAWAAEGRGSDAVTPLAWLGATTETLKRGTAIMQLPGRSPANTAMTAATLDQLSGGRFLLGLGASGPQVVEGWYGIPYGNAIKRVREYVEGVGAVWSGAESRRARAPTRTPGATIRCRTTPPTHRPSSSRSRASSTAGRSRSTSR